MNKKRLMACLLGGLISAGICLSGAYLRGMIKDMPFFTLAGAIFNRLLIGFVIAISGWRIHYLLHGAAIGFIVSLVSSLRLLPGDATSFVMYTAAGIFYGILIEFLATKIFRARQGA
jgi:hypothetical protein